VLAKVGISNTGNLPPSLAATILRQLVAPSDSRNFPKVRDALSQYNNTKQLQPKLVLRASLNASWVASWVAEMDLAVAMD
jgi:hypothetical protein